jgi:uncharacterized membrane protein YeaQ/YmgE (transglycosylase-associated protein family)
MGFCGWICFGFFAGLIARAVLPGDQQMGFVRTTLLGVAGSFVGGFLGAFLAGENPLEPRTSGFIGAVVGAVTILLVARLIRGRRRP